MSARPAASRAMPWALIAAACLGSFAATSSGTTRAPFLLEMARDLDVSMPLVANLVSMTATAWGIASALGGWLSDRFGRRPLLIAAPFALALAMTAQAFAGNFLWVAIWASVGGACAGTYTGVVFAEVSGRVEDRQRGRALGWVMSGQSLTLVVGVPMAAAVGSLIGWRGWNICVAGLALVACLCLFVTLGRGTAASAAMKDGRPSAFSSTYTKPRATDVAGPGCHMKRKSAATPDRAIATAKVISRSRTRSASWPPRIVPPTLPSAKTARGMAISASDRP